MLGGQDCELLGLHPSWGRPEEFVWQYISVPPVCIRPSVAQDGASNEDDLTVKLTEIVFTNALIKQGLAKGAPTPQFMARHPKSRRFKSSDPCPGTMGISPTIRRDVCQLRTSRSSLSARPKTYTRFCPASQRQTGPISRKLVRETCGFFGTYCYITGP
jgi:hypothetical protein